jgi:hypothetical protein
MSPRVPPEPPGDLALLTARLQAADIGHLAVDRFLGQTAVASVFLGHDVGTGRPVTLKLVDSDLAYDVGGAEFVRGIGSVRELAEPHVLPPATDPTVPGAICYVSPFEAPEPLRGYLARAQPLQFAEALQLATDAARALDHWHALGLAHGGVKWDNLQIQGGQVLLSPPEDVTVGADARRHDVEVLASICAEVLDRSTERPEADRRWERLRALLLRASRGAGPASLTPARLADRLTEAEYDATSPGAGRSMRFRRLLAAVWDRLRVIPGAFS